MLKPLALYVPGLNSNIAFASISIRGEREHETFAVPRHVAFPSRQGSRQWHTGIGGITTPPDKTGCGRVGNISRFTSRVWCSSAIDQLSINRLTIPPFRGAVLNTKFHGRIIPFPFTNIIVNNPFNRALFVCACS